jgi:hypothetical protein
MSACARGMRRPNGNPLHRERCDHRAYKGAAAEAQHHVFVGLFAIEIGAVGRLSCVFPNRFGAALL